MSYSQMAQLELLTACYRHCLRAVRITRVTNDSHFDILKQIDWPKLTIIAIKEFALQLDNDK